YGVVSNNYMRGGGDGYDVFETDAENAYDFGPDLAEVVAAYIMENGTKAAALDGRIMVK
ncbi:MAG: multifunctional 2',3'-cyclic-nucleotide 2'-phosphodiesterase/5'-nucleotidase/3'-nucleotidase, partial [Shimia sp.]